MKSNIGNSISVPMWMGWFYIVVVLGHAWSAFEYQTPGRATFVSLLVAEVAAGVFVWACWVKK